MVIRLCSILVTALLLSAVPATAQEGSKKGEQSGADEGDDEGSETDDPFGGDSDESGGAWERPPEDEERPPPEAEAPVVKPVVGGGKPISIGLVLGWGFTTDRTGGADPYGLSAGLRGGYSLPEYQVYLGAYFFWFLGSSETGGGGMVNIGEIESSANYLHYGIEAGYDVWIGSTIFRPSLQLGAGTILATVDGVDQSFSDFSFNPGATLIHTMDEFFLGGDLRGFIVSGDGISSVGVYATGGMRFE